MPADGAATKYPAMSIEQAHALLTQPGSMFEIGEADINGVQTKIWKNAPPTLAQIFAIGRFYADREFIIYEDERVTFDAHHRAATAFAQRLREEGVKPGDRVAINMRNLPEFSVAFWATVLVGAIATQLNAWWTPTEIEHGLAVADPVVAVVDSQRLQRMTDSMDRCRSLRRIFVSRNSEEIADPLVVKLETVIGAVDAWKDLPTIDFEPHAMAPDDDVAIFYTSGTTGLSKGAVLSHRNIISNMLNLGFGQARTLLRRGETPPTPGPHNPQRVGMMAIPLFHATGCCAGLIPSVLAGNKLVFIHKWDAGHALELIQREKINQTGGVPTLAWQLVEHPRAAEFDLSSIDNVSYGGAPSSPELVKRIKEQFPRVTMPGQGWGMTETAATATSNFGEDYLNKPASAGLAPPTGAMRIVDESGRDLPIGEVGELWYKGPVVVRGYWNNPKATAETFADGWLKTGDLARLDDEGFLYIVDRAKDMLIRGGENIYCTEVENALYEHPAVMDAAVVGIPHQTLGEEPGAIVMLKPGAQATEEELRHHVAQRLAAFKVPVKVKFWSETLPRNPAGKILKRELRSVFQPADA